MHDSASVRIARQVGVFFLEVDYVDDPLSRENSCWRGSWPILWRVVLAETDECLGHSSGRDGLDPPAFINSEDAERRTAEGHRLLQHCFKNRFKIAGRRIDYP